jgi:hypothetical protein
MAKFTVRNGWRYRAIIRLTGLKRLAPNETIAGVLRGVGFTEVSVEGSGGTRYAEALWPKPDAAAEIPPEVVKVEEAGAPIAALAALPARPERKAKARSKSSREKVKPARSKPGRKKTSR